LGAWHVVCRSIRQNRPTGIEPGSDSKPDFTYSRVCLSVFYFLTRAPFSPPTREVDHGPGRTCWAANFTFANVRTAISGNARPITEGADIHQIAKKLPHQRRDDREILCRSHQDDARCFGDQSDEGDDPARAVPKGSPEKGTQIGALTTQGAICPDRPRPLYAVRARV
jgi:hypothetical protein